MARAEARRVPALLPGREHDRNATNQGGSRAAVRTPRSADSDTRRRTRQLHETAAPQPSALSSGSPDLLDSQSLLVSRFVSASKPRLECGRGVAARQDDRAAAPGGAEAGRAPALV